MARLLSGFCVVCDCDTAQAFTTPLCSWWPDGWFECIDLESSSVREPLGACSCCTCGGKQCLMKHLRPQLEWMFAVQISSVSAVGAPSYTREIQSAAHTKLHTAASTAAYYQPTPLFITPTHTQHNNAVISLRCEFEDGVDDVLVLLECLHSLCTAAVGLVHDSGDLVGVQAALVRRLTRLLLLFLLLRWSSLRRSSSLTTQQATKHE